MASAKLGERVGAPMWHGDSSCPLLWYWPSLVVRRLAVSWASSGVIPRERIPGTPHIGSQEGGGLGISLLHVSYVGLSEVPLNEHKLQNGFITFRTVSDRVECSGKEETLKEKKKERKKERERLYERRNGGK